MSNIYDTESWRVSLSAYAYAMSRGEWRPWKYLVYVANKIENAIRKGNGRLIINMPFRHGKSFLTSKWLPTWYLDLYPQNRVILASYGATLANEWGRAVRDELQNNPNAITKPRYDVRAVDRWSTLEGGGMVSVGVNKGVTGKGGDLIIVDDPHKDWAEAISQLISEGIYDWFKNTLYPRREPGATIIVNHTRWTSYDLTGKVLSDPTQKGWEVVRLPALAEDDDPLGREKGEALCPERFSKEELRETLRTMGLAGEGLIQQNPVSLEGNIVKQDQINRFRVWPDSLDEILQSWDATFKKTGTSKVGCVVVGRKDANYYFLDQFQQKLSFTETLRAIRDMSIKHPNAIGKVIEDKANGSAICDVYKDKLEGIIPFNPDKYGSKEARFSAVSPLFEAGNIWVPENSLADWGDGLIAEWVNFPNHPFQDRTDATSQALLHFQNKLKKTNVFNIDMGVVGGVRTNPWEISQNAG